jgi:hypothetical protein
MSTPDNEAERIARAKRLREEIEKLTGSESELGAAPPKQGTPPRKMTPREFTDKAAAEAAKAKKKK